MNAETSVPVAKYLGIFTISYIGLMTILGLAVSLLGIKSSSGMNSALLIGACMGTSALFVNKYKRLFTKIEYRRMVAGSIAINIVIQIVLSLLSLGMQAIGTIFLVAFLLGIVHGLVIAFFYSKRMTKSFLPKPKPVP